MAFRYIYNEVKRMVLRPFSLLLAGVIVVIGIAGIIQPNGDPNRLIAFWSVQRPFMLNLVVPLTASIVSAGAVAWELRTGYTQLVLARGFSRRTYFFAKAAACAISAGAITLLGYLGFYLIAIFFLPWGVSNPNTLYFEGISSYPGPVSPLFLTNPILNDLLGIAMVTTATATLALLGVLVGVVVKNEYIATIAPFFFYLAGGFLLRGSLEILSPFVHIDVWGQYKYKFSLDVLPFAAFVYWFVLGVVILQAAWFIFHREELTV